MMQNTPHVFLQIRSQPKDVIGGHTPDSQGFAEPLVADILSLLQKWKVKNVFVFSAADSTFYDSSQINGTYVISNT